MEREKSDLYLKILSQKFIVLHKMADAFRV